MRLLGIDGVDGAGVPLVNRIVEELQSKGVLARGAMFWVVNAVLNLNLTAQQFAEGVARTEINLTELSRGKDEDVNALALVLAETALAKNPFSAQGA